MGKTSIEWTDATWNPITGCSKVSQGCKECYAERLFPKTYPGRAFTDVRFHPERLEQPIHWRKPRMIFVNSMSDLFHENISAETIAEILAVAGRAPQHVFQVLTKRPGRMKDIISDIVSIGCVQPPNNLWLGVSVEDQKSAEERIPVLLQTPAAIRWISYEPALGPVDLKREWLSPQGMLGTELDWVVAGGESGPRARPSHPDWFRCVRDQCQKAGVPFLFKQWGAYVPEFPQYPEEYGLDSDTDICSGKDFPNEGVIYRDGYFYNGIEHQPHTNHGAYWVGKVGKKRSGRILDGREWSEFPRREA